MDGWKENTKCDIKRSMSSEERTDLQSSNSILPSVNCTSSHQLSCSSTNWSNFCFQSTHCCPMPPAAGRKNCTHAVRVYWFICLCVVDCASTKMILHFRQQKSQPVTPAITLSFSSTCKYFSILSHRDQSQRQLALFFSFGMKCNEDDAACCSTFGLLNVEKLV